MKTSDWNNWNVSLWIGNDEQLYLLAKDCIKACKTRKESVLQFIQLVPPTTPDGAKYTQAAVSRAFRDLFEDT